MADEHGFNFKKCEQLPKKLGHLVTSLSVANLNCIKTLARIIDIFENEWL